MVIVRAGTIGQAPRQRSRHRRRGPARRWCGPEPGPAWRHLGTVDWWTRRWYAASRRPW